MPTPSAFDAVRWMAGAEPLSADQERAALLAADGDAVQAALAAHGQPADRQAAESVRAWLHSAAKKPLPREPVDVRAVAGDEPAASEIGRAAKAGQVRRSPGGQLLASDPGSRSHWLLRPSKRAGHAAAFAEILDAWRLGHYLIEASAVTLDGESHLAERLAPKDAAPMDDAGLGSVNSARLILLPPLQDGSLHRWAAADYVLGNPDRLESTVLLSEWGACFLRCPEGVFAEPFDPPTDRSSFLPAYMRVWGPARWAQMSPLEKRRAWPDPPVEMAGQLSGWLSGLPEEPIKLVCARRGLDPSGPLGRLGRLKREAEVDGVGLALARAWCG